MEQCVADLADMQEEEEFPDEFQCCVCLDIMYKPVVLACGHISCFWCTFKAMCNSMQSHCPICRNPYNHFPRSCGLLHFLLLKLYPSPYKSRAKQVAGLNFLYLICDKLLLSHFMRYAVQLDCKGKWELFVIDMLESANNVFSLFSPVYWRLIASTFYMFSDSAQIYPITGVRYKCKDCVEKIGFDLCESCYKISAKLPGRFNQQHTMDHKFDAIQPNFVMVLSSFGAELSAEDDGSGFGSEDDGVA
ncbi:E3 ubiquitin-protein ligase PRT1 [Salvia hispanica]|uniref:E3 ubiquitin-protein ligase PRT1 n=1 Tax=Salvia hispanica TaxID=49212 RepID=UPI00200946A3|nr:E3 ubiquitin-protein ligase PRT1 [Salvia hispanica]